MSELIPLALPLAMNLATLFVIVELVYQRVEPRRDYALTYVLFNLLTFFLCYLLHRVPIELGFALGLFAIFGILRYRTESIRIRDLTYLFVVIGLGILHAVGAEQVAAHEAIAVDIVITSAVVLLERPMSRMRVEEKLITYDRLDLLAPREEAALYADIEARTGFPVRRVSIESVDLVRQVATITVHWVRDRKRSV